MNEQTAANEIMKTGEGVRREWLACIDPMNRDDLLEAKIEALNLELNASPDFLEGFLYRSMLRILSGDRVKAVSDLIQAEALLFNPSRSVAIGTGIDFVYASLMVGNGPDARRCIRFIEKKWPNDPAVQHIQALCETEENDFSKAAELYRKALKAKETQYRGLLCGDAAWLFAAVPVDRLRNPKLAEDCIDEALRISRNRSWKAWRAKSVLHADANEWEEAKECLHRAMADGPKILDAAFREQCAAYSDKKTYRIERTAKR